MRSRWPETSMRSGTLPVAGRCRELCDGPARVGAGRLRRPRTPPRWRDHDNRHCRDAPASPAQYYFGPVQQQRTNFGGAGGHSRRRRSGEARRRLAGAWPGPAGACSWEYLEWFINASGSYTSTWNSAPLVTVPAPAGTTTTAVVYRNGCEGGVTAYGTWSVHGNLLTFRQQAAPDCPECTQQTDIPVTFSFEYGDLRLCDYPSGGCWDYALQKGASDQRRARATKS